MSKENPSITPCHMHNSCFVDTSVKVHIVSHQFYLRALSFIDFEKECECCRVNISPESGYRTLSDKNEKVVLTKEEYNEIEKIADEQSVAHKD